MLQAQYCLVEAHLVNSLLLQLQPNLPQVHLALELKHVSVSGVHFQRHNGISHS